MPAPACRRYQTQPGVVLGVDDVAEAETLLSVRLVSGLRVLAPANSERWAAGQDVEVLMDRSAGAAFLGLAVRRPRRA